MTTTTTTIKSLLADCRAEAERHGLPAGADWEPTAADLEYVCDRLGRKPTADEWRAVGLAWVGDAHVGEGAAHG